MNVTIDVMLYNTNDRLRTDLYCVAKSRISERVFDNLVGLRPLIQNINDVTKSNIEKFSSKV